jgi:hypothetical protein
MQWREGRPAHAAGRVAAAAAHVARVGPRVALAGPGPRTMWRGGALGAREVALRGVRGACMHGPGSHVRTQVQAQLPALGLRIHGSSLSLATALSEAERDICRGQPYLRVATTMARSLHCFPVLPLSLSCFCNTKTCSYLASESSRLRVAFEEETSPSRVSTKQCTTAFINGQKGR